MVVIKQVVGNNVEVYSFNKYGLYTAVGSRQRTMNE